MMPLIALNIQKRIPEYIRNKMTKKKANNPKTFSLGTPRTAKTVEKTERIAEIENSVLLFKI